MSRNPTEEPRVGDCEQGGGGNLAPSGFGEGRFEPLRSAFRPYNKITQEDEDNQSGNSESPRDKFLQPSDLLSNPLENYVFKNLNPMLRFPPGVGRVMYSEHSLPSTLAVDL